MGWPTNLPVVKLGQGYCSAVAAWLTSFKLNRTENELHVAAQIQSTCRVFVVNKYTCTELAKPVEMPRLL